MVPSNPECHLPTPYLPRRPADTTLYRLIQRHLETFLALCRENAWEQEPMPAFAEEQFRRYLKCGILAHGFARAHCSDCGHDFLIAFSCKGRGVCPSCNARRMAETAAHLVENVIPRLPVRQWVLSIPKRLRYFLRNDPRAINTALHIFLHAVESYLRESSLDADLTARIGAVAFIHRFGSSLNDHIHFHCVVLDGVFDKSPDGESTLHFHEATIHNTDIEPVQEKIRKRILRAFVRRGFIDRNDAKEMLSWEHGGGFSLYASARIEENDREGLERLLRYCARPSFALERIEEVDSETIIYHSPDSSEEGATQLRLTPFELIARIAALIPPPRLHRHRYFGVLAPNALLRDQVTALAQSAQSTSSSSQEIQENASPSTPSKSSEPDTQPPSSSVSPKESIDIQNSSPSPSSTGSNRASKSKRISWAILLARIYEIFPLLCPLCGGTIQIISFVIETPSVRRILEHIGEPMEPPRVSPARGPPIWDEEINQDSLGDPLAQLAPDYEFDQTISW